MKYDQMDMRRSVGMSIHQFQEFACGSIEGNWIRCWTDAVEGVFAVVVCDEFATEVVFFLVVVLLLVETWVWTLIGRSTA